MAAKRKATASWTGDLASGSGTVDLTSSGAGAALPVSWAARTEDSAGGKTSPEELIAAAYAACFCMALSVGLAKAGHKPEQLHVTAESTFEKVGDGFAFTTLHVSARGTVPGIDAAAFEQAAEGASQNCPVSKALKGNVKISVDAKLEA
jgi:osmotically inducible protein OsmC